MMLVAHISDSHVSALDPRHDECVRVHRRFVQICRDEKPDLILHGGDLYDTASTPLDRLAAAELLYDLAEIAPVVVCRGNHDALRDVYLLGQIRSKHPIRVVEDASCETIALTWRRGTEFSQVAVAVAAYPRTAHVVAADANAGDALRKVYLDFADRFAKAPASAPRILLTHVMVRGSRTTAGQPQIGTDVEVGVEDLALAGADLVALGHVHAHQHWACARGVAIYPGSPYRTNFGEREEKGVVLAELVRGVNVPHGARVEWRFVPTDARQIVDVDLAQPELVSLPAGAEVRIRYTATDADRATLRVRAAELADRLRAAGHPLVQVDAPEIKPTVTARVPQIRDAVSVRDKLRTLWDARSTPDAETRGRLERLLEELEAP